MVSANNNGKSDNFMRQRFYFSKFIKFCFSIKKPHISKFYRNGHYRNGGYDTASTSHFTPFIHSAMSVSTSGEMVSVMVPYSAGRPVWQCWKRWFSEGYSLMRWFLFFCSNCLIDGRLREEITWQSLSPFIAMTGHFTAAMSFVGS